MVVARAEVGEVGLGVEDLAGEVDLAGAVLQVRRLAPGAAEVGFGQRSCGVGARAHGAQFVGVHPIEACGRLGAEVAAAEIGFARQQVLVRVQHSHFSSQFCRNGLQPVISETESIVPPTNDV